MMNKEELELLLNGPEWLIPLLQDIYSNQITRKQMDMIFKYMEKKKLREKSISFLYFND